MRNLLHGNLRRLARDRVFYIVLLCTFIIALFICFDNAPTMAEMAKAGEEDAALENFYFNLCPTLGLFYSAFACLFVGTEHSDGTLRNKLIAGRSRTKIYCSMFLTVFIGCLLIMFGWLIASLGGLFYFSGFSFGWIEYLKHIAVITSGTAVFAALYTSISLLFTNKALEAVISLVLWFVLLFTASMIVDSLNQPLMTAGYSISNAGIPIQGEPFANPYFVSGFKRTVLTILSYINPVCPTIEIDGGTLARPILTTVYALITAVSIGGVSCILFNRKDLK